MSDLKERAREIAEFLGIPESAAIERLSKGFGFQHQAVNDDFRRCNPQTDEALLNWYRTTPEYIWELSAYHLDPGFNYAGMCAGIAERLKAEGANKVLCLGDGIGDLTLSLFQSDLSPVYHDLENSQTSEFAAFRMRQRLRSNLPFSLTATFEPVLRGQYDAVVSLDYLEHCVNVPDWVSAIHSCLKPGGLLVSQNAFNCGSGPDGSIPMHLAVNDKYEKEWDPLLFSLGFVQLSSNWYQKPA